MCLFEETLEGMENGQKREEGPYKGKTRIGEWTWWYDSGKKWKQGSYLGGERNGTWEFWKRASCSL